MAQKLNIDIVARDKSTQALGRLQGSLAKVKASVFNLKNAFIGLGAGLVIRGIVNAGMHIEELGVQLEALFGSAEKGKKALDTVTKFAKTTPFELSNIQQGVTALATVAEKAESLGISFEELLKITGNTAVQLGGDFAIASQQIQRSFSAGIGSADLFRDKAVTAMAGFSAGVKTSVDESIKGLAKAFGTGGKFGELTNKLAQTLSGTISNLKDAFFTIQTEIASGFFDELKRQLGDLKKFTETNDEAIRRLSREMGVVLADAILKLSNGIKVLIKNFKDLQAVLGVLLIAFGGFVRIIAGAVLIINDFNRRLGKLLGTTKEVKKEMITLRDILSSADANSGFVEPLEEAFVIVHDFEHELSHRIPTATEKAIQKFREMNDGVLEDIKKKKENIRMIIAEGINSGITKMSEALSRSLVLGEKLSDTFRNMALNVLGKIISALIEQIARQAISIAMENTQIGQLMTKLGIEKLITAEKNAQQSASSNGSNDMGSSLIRMFAGGFASGGAVSKGQPIMVGENGAEMFVPNQTGQITQSARGTGGGGSTTVNFNINTVDARGFDELLTQSRGTITQLINQAVNERGAKSII
jgi:hypothetical protein